MALTKKEQDAIIISKAMRAASKRRTATKIIVIILLASLVLSGGAWGIISFVEQNSMMVSVDQTKEGLSLCQTPDFEKPVTKLNMQGPEKMDAYTYTWFFTDKFLGKDGPHHDNNYICYSFYLKNVSPTNGCLYTMETQITKNIKNTSSALRILIIESDMNCNNEVETAKVYAQKKSDGLSEYIAYDDCTVDQEPNTLEMLNASRSPTSNLELLDTNVAYPFLEDVYNKETEEYLGFFAMREEGKKLDYNSYKKYTIVMWLEGTDLQCTNEILGGKCTVQINFKLEKYLDVEYYGE